MIRNQMIWGVLLSSLLLFSTCGERDWNSPFDPEGSNKSEWAPQDLRVVQDSEAGLSLSWTIADERVTGYIVSRKLGNNTWVVLTNELAAGAVSYTDQIQSLNVTHRYRVVAVADESQSSASEIEITPIFTAVEITGLETFPSPDSLQITWREHEFSSVVGYLVQRQENAAGYMTRDTVIGSNMYLDRGLDTLLGDYGYRVLAFTSTGTLSDSSAETSVRFRNVGYRLSWQNSSGGRFQSSPDGETVYVIGESSSLRALASADGSVHWQHDIPYSSFVVSPDGNTIAAGGRNDVGLRLLNAATGTMLWREYDPNFAYSNNPIAYSPSGNNIIYSFQLRLRNIDVNQNVVWRSELIGTYCAWSNDASKLLFWGRYSNPYVGILDVSTQDILWEAGSRTYSDTASLEYQTVSGLGWHESTGNYWMTGANEDQGWIKYFSGSSHEIIWENTYASAMTAVAPPVDGYLYVKSGLQSLSKIDLNTGDPAWEIPEAGQVAAYLHGAGIIAAVTNGTNILSIIDAERGVILQRQDLPTYAQNILFSADGSRLFINTGELLAYRRYGLWILDPAGGGS